MAKRLLISYLLSSVLLLSSCGIIDMVYLPPSEDTAQEIFEAANDAMAEKNYVRAVELYNKLRDAYPFSPYTIDAELSLADAYFLDEEYELAAETYKDFESLHPRHQAMPYVVYQTGMSLLNQFRSIDRATTILEEAYAYFNRVCEMYPDTPYVRGAEENMKKCRRLMAEHELYIADVFWNMGKNGVAWKRYEYISKTFSDVPEIAEHAREKSIVAYQKYREEGAQEIRDKREGSWKNWFTWL
ncbi:MAG: outer membrane protein assembly factor BamD [Desulfovibrio sp.]|nr:outer membrane protein assembly factor BamD [Desulfovibrio sp.]